MNVLTLHYLHPLQMTSITDDDTSSIETFTSMLLLFPCTSIGKFIEMLYVAVLVLVLLLVLRFLKSVSIEK